VISKEGQAEGVKLPLKVWYRGEEVSLVEDGDISGQSGSDGALESRERTVSVSEIFRRCAIAMPTDTQRNMMNASSNYRIISGIVKVMRGETESVRLFIPGADGHIGGYPMIIGRNDDIDAGAAVVDDGNPSGGGDLVVYARIDESVFTMEEMEKANRESLYLDGVEDVRDGVLYYTDELIDKVYKAFGVNLPKSVAWDDIEKVAAFLIDEIILKAK
ncbi:MAG: hypothetical protein II915_01800, partial [Eubacterium sp.]|nr:hypothetical protein [Eubacterium sp.]